MAMEYNIEIEQGATFEFPLVYKSGGTPVDLSGCMARMQIRRDYDAPFPLASVTTENGGITLGGVAGTIYVEIDEDTTKNLPVKPAVYDLELVLSSGKVRRIVQGAVVVLPEVTK